jgi:hypothetical protein
MKTALIKRGGVYENSRTGAVRQVLQIGPRARLPTPACDDWLLNAAAAQVQTDRAADQENGWVLYHAVDGAPLNDYHQFDRLAPLPSEVEFQTAARVSRGVSIAICPLAGFGRWATRPAVLPARTYEPGKTMAELCLGRVTQRGYRDISFERAVSFDCVRAEFLPAESAAPWTYIFRDGSRVAFWPPGFFCEVDSSGRPLLTSPHCLDLEQRYREHSTARHVLEDFRKWLPHARP